MSLGNFNGALATQYEFQAFKFKLTLRAPSVSAAGFFDSALVAKSPHPPSGPSPICEGANGEKAIIVMSSARLKCLRPRDLAWETVPKGDEGPFDELQSFPNTTLAIAANSSYLAAHARVITNVIVREISSVGRALRLHRRCREFESLISHQPSPVI